MLRLLQLPQGMPLLIPWLLYLAWKVKLRSS
jgi:hypothetical protein